MPCLAPRRRASRGAAAVALLALLAAAAAAPGEEVVGFTLIDADADLPLGPLVAGQVVDLAVTGGALAVRADTDPATVGSVVFDLDGMAGFRTESAAPYALFGDSGGDFAPWSGPALLGIHTLTATPYAAAGGSGTPGTPLTVDFEIVDTSPPGGGSTIAWEVREDSPEGHFEGQGLALGGALYVFGGFFPGVQATPASYAYDPAADAWRLLAPMPEPLTHAAQAADGASVYVAGGFVGDSPGASTPSVWVYDTDADQWTAGTPLPADRGGGGLARVGRALHFFAGGTRTAGVGAITDFADHWVLDLGPTDSPADDAASWTPRAPLPGARNHLGAAAVGGRVYAVGGQLGTDETSGNRQELFEYDPQTDTWTRRADLPRPLSHTAASVFPMDGRLVVVAGVTQDSEEVADLLLWDPPTDTWVALPSLPEPRQSPVAGLVGRQFVVNGGAHAGTRAQTWLTRLAGRWETGAPLPVPLGEVAGDVIGGTLFLLGEGDPATLALDLATGSWLSTSLFDPRPYPGHHHAAVVQGGKLYVLGGLGGGSEGEVQIFDPAAAPGGQWTLGAPMPFGAGSCNAVGIAGRIYVAGGIVGGSTSDAVAAYHPATDTWSAPLASMPAGVNHAAHATDGQRMYVFGGRSGGNSVQDGFDHVQVYDPATDSWDASSLPGSILAPLPQARGGTGRAVYHDGRFYVLGGETRTGAGATPDDVYDRVDVYVAAANRWETAAPMPTARHGIWPVLHAGRIHVAGGGVQKGSSQSTVLEIYNLELASVAVPALSPSGAAGLALLLVAVALAVGERARPRALRAGSSSSAASG